MEATENAGAIPETDSTPPYVAVESAGKGTARPADAAATGAAEPLPTHPLEAHLNALPRAPLMPFDATGRMAAAIPFAFDDYLELMDSTGALTERFLNPSLCVMVWQQAESDSFRLHDGEMSSQLVTVEAKDSL